MIISMATESYLEWIHHFVKALEGNTDDRILINLINVSKEKQAFVKKQFPNIIFISHKIDADKREVNNPDGKCFKVTYLKGRFVRQAFNKYKEPVLWIDITALIRKDLSQITNKFQNADTLLMRRNFNKDKGKSVYACEIFGMNSKTEIDRYYKECNSHDKHWYSDQLALCELGGKIDYIEFGKWSNFGYDPIASSWSDRGRRGIGTITLDDVDFTHNKFIDDLCKKDPKYRDKFEKYKIRISNPKILIHVDDIDWCYATSVNEVAKIQGFDVTVIYDIAGQRNQVMNWNGDLVWGRCGSYRHKKLLALRPDLRSISFSTNTTGGNSLIDRFYRQTRDGEGEAGVIVQNEEARVMFEHYNKKSKNGQKCFILPNGVNTKKFKKKKHHKRENYVVGFVGRSQTEPEKFGKGVHYLDFCTDMSGLKTKMASNTETTRVDFKDMPKFYQSIDVLLLPTDSEGCSNTINEAMASGLPVITPKLGWHGDVCKNTEILFCDRNIKKIYEALESLKNPLLRECFGNNSRDFAERHSWPNMLNYYKETFEKMIMHVKKFKPESIVIKKKTEPIIESTLLKVRGLKKVNLGKLERDGDVLWFVKDTIRQIPNDDKHKKAIKHYIKNGYLEILN